MPRIIEGSKVFSKNLMKKYGIPTAAYEVFDDRERGGRLMCRQRGYARLSSRRMAWRWARACSSAQTARSAAGRCHVHDEGQRSFGASGSRVVIEEFLTGPEVSVLAFTDGKTVKPMVSSMDHKRAL